MELSKTEWMMLSCRCVETVSNDFASSPTIQSGRTEYNCFLHTMTEYRAILISW